MSADRSAFGNADRIAPNMPRKKTEIENEERSTGQYRDGARDPRSRGPFKRERTYSRDTMERAKAAWKAGDFSREWAPWYRLAVKAGIIFPPEGTKWDSWDDDDPSQRAIVVRAMRETPTALRVAIEGARSWGEVVGRVLRVRDDIRELADIAAEDVAWERQEQGTPREATASLAAILRRINDSQGIEENVA